MERTPVGHIFLSLSLLSGSSSNGHDSIGATAAVAQQAMAALEERGAKISEVAEKSEQLKEVSPRLQYPYTARCPRNYKFHLFILFILGGIGFPKDDKSPATTAAAEAFERWRLLRRGSKTLYIEQRQDQAFGGVLLKPAMVILLCFFVCGGGGGGASRYSSYSSSDGVRLPTTYFCSDGYQALIRIFSVICDMNEEISSKFDYWKHLTNIKYSVYCTNPLIITSI